MIASGLSYLLQWIVIATGDIQLKNLMPALVIHAYSPNTLDAEAEELQEDQGQP